MGEVGLRLATLYGWAGMTADLIDYKKQEEILLEALELAKEVNYEKEEKRISQWLEELSEQKSKQKTAKTNNESIISELDIENKRFEEE